MSNFYVDVVDRPIYYLTVDSSINNDLNNIEIIKYNDYNLEIVNTEKVLASDLPDDIPISKITGNWPISRIDFTDVYGIGFDGLDSYLDQYEFDCGEP